MIRKAAALLGLLAFGACSQPDAPPPAPEPIVETTAEGLTIVEAGSAEASAMNTPVPATTTPPVAATPPPTVVAYVTVVDLEGKPLPGIGVIVTTKPNAFDEPLAVGGLSGPDGKTWVRFTSDQTLFVRAWDPKLERFPNNFYEVPAGEGASARDMVLSMVSAAGMEASFFLPGGSPAVNTRVELMMAHPEWGPWWPAEIITDDTGRATFPRLPPGQYTMAFQVATGAMATMPGILLSPGSTTNIGQVPLL